MRHALRLSRLGRIERDARDGRPEVGTTNHAVEGVLRLGLLYPTAGGPHLTAIVATFERRHPGCEIQLSEVLLDDPLGPLRRGEIDVMATRLPVDKPDLVVGPVLSREPRVVQVARHHPLAARAEVSLEDLADHHVAPLRAFPSETVESVIPALAPSGRPIRRLRPRHALRTAYDVEALIARGRIVHPTVASYADYFGHPDIIHVPLTDMPPAETGLIWPRRHDDPRVRRFVEIARHTLSSVPPQQNAGRHGESTSAGRRRQRDEPGHDPLAR